MRLASVAVTRSVTWCGLPKAGSCSRLRYSATAAYSGDSVRSLRTVRDDLMRYAGAAISQAIPAGAGPGRPALLASRGTSRDAHGLRSGGAGGDRRFTAHADVSEFRQRILMQRPASPFVVSNAVRGTWLGAGRRPWLRSCVRGLTVAGR